MAAAQHAGTGAVGAANGRGRATGVQAYDGARSVLPGPPEPLPGAKGPFISPSRLARPNPVAPLL